MKYTSNHWPNIIISISKTTLTFLFLLTIILASGCSGLRKTTVAQKSIKPKNIIFFIADGCGYNHVDAASYYTYGQTGKQSYEQFPVKYGMSTLSIVLLISCSMSYPPI